MTGQPALFLCGRAFSCRPREARVFRAGLPVVAVPHGRLRTVSLVTSIREATGPACWTLARSQLPNCHLPDRIALRSHPPPPPGCSFPACHTGSQQACERDVLRGSVLCGLGPSSCATFKPGTSERCRTASEDGLCSILVRTYMLSMLCSPRWSKCQCMRAPAHCTRLLCRDCTCFKS